MTDLEFIPLIRYLLRTAIKEKISGKSSGYAPIDLSKSGIVEYLLNAELKQKSGQNLSKSYVYGGAWRK
jgi:hypothetical protein